MDEAGKVQEPRSCRRFQGPRVVAFRRKPPTRRGVALLLALIVVVAAATIASSWLAGQGTSVAIARNIRDHAAARYVAESGMELALRYVLTHGSWRTERSVGVWLSDQLFGAGSFTIRCDDGMDLNGDGVIGPGEGDGDLANNAADPATLTVTGRVGASTHVVRVVVQIPYVGYDSVLPNREKAKR